MIKLKLKSTKVFKVGNSFAIRIPKALVDTDVLSTEGFYDVEVSDAKKEEKDIITAPLFRGAFSNFMGGVGDNSYEI